MTIATMWHWVWAIAALMATAMIVRRVFRIATRAAIRVRNTGRPLSMRERVLLRYQDYAFHPLFFAWCKTRQDAMFDELPGLLEPVKKLHTFLDLGCGFGVAGSFLLELYPDSEIYAVDPNPDRVAGAKLAFGNRGHVFEGAAPDFEKSPFPPHFDAVFSIDMMHYLDDGALGLTLSRIHARLEEGSFLVIRAPMRPAGFGSLIWKLTRIHQRAWGLFAQYRTVEQLRAHIERAGFAVIRSEMSGNNPELHWFVSTAVRLEQKVERFVAEPVSSVGHNGKEHHH